jgi:hypothetical protein
MAKMFYSLEEAAKRLHKSEDEVRQMASSGQLQEFRDGQKLMFKVEQVDLLAPDDESADDILSLEPSESGGDSGFGLDLADDSAAGGAGFGGSLSLGDSGADLGLDLGDEPAGSPSSKADSAGRSGISVFDVDDLEQADPSAVTQVNDQGGFGALLDDSAAMETVGSGSGLMDLTREKDDTSLGAAGLLDDIYANDEAASNETIGASGLFEATGASSDEPLVAAGSGLVGGLALGTALALGMALVVSVMGILGSTSLVNPLADQFMIVVGALAGVTLIFAVIGLVLGKRG